MWKAGLLGVLALVIGSSAAFADGEAGISQRAIANYDATMSINHVTKLKSVLKLTLDQEQLWPAIERAFREISQAQEAAAPQGLVQNIKQKVAAIGLNTLALRRLATAADPLIRTLTDEQKQKALSFARSVGLNSVAAAF